MVVSEDIHTVADFELFATAHTDRRCELIDGKMVEYRPAHQPALIVAIMTTTLMNYLGNHPLGHVLVETRYRLPGDDRNARVPDLAFIANERVPSIRQGVAPYMPDLAVEVQSPDQTAKHLLDKAAYYLVNGTQMVWLVYPEQHLVECLTITDRRLLVEPDILDGGDLLPGFTLALSQLFTQA